MGLLGAGTVGREVARMLLARSTPWAVDGSRLELVAIAVRDVDRARANGLRAQLLTDAPAHVVASPDTDVIVEVIGGDEPGHTLTLAALAAGKSVVTANKHVVAHHGAALEAAARSTGAALRFEASVGGGTPVLGPLATDLAAAEIGAVRGIVNGTTNYILSAMADEGRDYADVLAAAQAAGYAEADPSGDVEGRDAGNKLVILARLAFGCWLDPRDVATTSRDGPGAGRPGITGVTADAIARARQAGRVVKLVAEARRGTAGEITACVLAREVPADSDLGRTAGVLNRIEVDAAPLGTVAFSGPGAGGPATATAVVADLIAISRGLGSTW
ncbi:MAG TPA: homoserine dehydrogenase, partial [Candidatus Limnocylindrales bacterium]|nr:homoserine dehydrogenase [Candidatus Limnocylindrales bacterium]